MKNIGKISSVLLILLLGCTSAAAAEQIEVVEVVQQIGPQSLRPVLKPIHAVLGVTSPLLLLVAAGVAYTMVDSSGSSHLSVPHAWLGLTAGGLTLLMPLLGFSIFWLPKRGRTLRTLHAWLGRLALLLLSIGCVSGILM